jgi:hypothetical protein
MKSSRSIFVVFCLSIPIIGFTQNVKDEVIEYTYVKLPLQPLDKSIKTYQATIWAAFEAENLKRKGNYDSLKKLAELEFKKETEAYPAKVKAAEDTYNAEMEEYKKKSLGEKVVENKILGENNKPVKQIPPTPYLRSVAEPVLQTSYDYPVVAKTYLQLGGFENRPSADINIKVVIHGFDYTQPRQMSLQKNITSVSNGNSSTRPVNYYYTEFSYRHPMSVEVTLADGKVIYNATPQELNVYTIYKSNESETPAPINKELLIKTNEEKIFQSGLTFINNLINDKIGFHPVKRNATLFYVKTREDTYQDLLTAFNEATSGLKLMTIDEVTAKEKLEKAARLWNTALAESDLNDKKTRINKDVTVMLLLNLLEINFALRNPEEAEKIIT